MSQRRENVHKPQVSCRPTRNVWFKRDTLLFSILAGQPKVLVKHQDRAINNSIGEATAHWHMAFFDALCQLAYMIYITNTNARINILSKLQGICCLQFMGECYNRPPSRLGRG